MGGSQPTDRSFVPSHHVKAALARSRTRKQSRGSWGQRRLVRTKRGDVALQGPTFFSSSGSLNCANLDSFFDSSLADRALTEDDVRSFVRDKLKSSQMSYIAIKREFIQVFGKQNFEIHKAHISDLLHTRFQQQRQLSEISALFDPGSSPSA